MPTTTDSRHLSLFILAALITLTLAAIRGLVRRARVVMVVSGTSVLLVVLAVLAIAYVITLGVG
ncbi:hypothetical protein [Nonomuraea solani]|nr:hypothetical protein [Nonomuraea solani]